MKHRTLAAQTFLCSIFLSVFSVTASPGTDLLPAGFASPPAEARPSAYWLWLNGYYNRDYAERELRAMRDAGIRGLCIFDMGARGDKAGMPPAGPAFMGDQSTDDLAHAIRLAGRLGLKVQLSVASSWDMGGAWVEPRYASMGLFQSRVAVEGPQDFDQELPFPAVSSKAPRNEDGSLAFFRNVAVLAVPAGRRRPGHDFIFKLDPPGMHTLSHAVLYNTASDDPKTHGPLNLFTKDFSIAVSEGGAGETDFREVLRASMEPDTEPQRFDLPPVQARYVRLRILSGHNPRFDRVQLGEFELFDTAGVNVVASHVADRSRDGATLIGYLSSLGQDKTWSAGNIHDGAKSGPGGSWSSAGPPPLVIASPRDVIDLTDRIDDEGRLRWKAPPGQWEILRYVCANTGERLKVPSPNSDGLATDHFSREATRVFLDYLIQRLQAKLGDLNKTALTHLYLASYEVRGAIWTPDMLDQFAAYRGYDMQPYLPALSGCLIVDDETTSRFIYDYRKTLGDLLVDAYYRVAVQAAHEAGLGIESEAGGPGPPIHQVPVDALKAQGAIDSIRGEFWPKRPKADRLWVVKETACAGHTYGKRLIHMEAFTSMHHWQDGPIDLKPAADRAFCEGANHLVWHTSTHLPPEAGKPGWVYLAGTHITPNLVWWDQAQPFIDYLSRCSYLLQQGLFVADVCYYYGDQGYNFVPPRHTNPLPAQGYDYDVCNREVILNRMSVRNGRIALPDGMSFAVLVLPERNDIDLEVLQRIEQFVRDGAIVIGPKPSKATGLAGYPDRDAQVREIADRVWGDGDRKVVGKRAYGKGCVIWGRGPAGVLKEMGVGPDFQYRSRRDGSDLDFIHRSTGKASIYFVRNRRDVWDEVDAVFRVRGRVPELWDPATGEMSVQHVYRPADSGTLVPLRLPPHGSIFVVFRRPVPEIGPLQLESQPRATDRASQELSPVEVIDWNGTAADLLVSQPGRCRVIAGWGRAEQVQVDRMPRPIGIAGPWHVHFSDCFGEERDVELERLVSWTEHEDDSIRYFSGHATYSRAFFLPEEWVRDDLRIMLDLGRLWAVGDVALNGKRLGVLWKPPYAVDVTEAVRAGNNELAVTVANTWSNRLVGDARLPVEQRKTRTNVPASNGVRWKDVPLLESGLFGPVRLLPAKVIKVGVGPRD